MIAIDDKATSKSVLQKLRDPVTFIESFLRFQGKPFKLYDWQKRIAREVNLLHDKVCLQKARQVGGSLFVASLIVFASFINNDAKFIVVSKTARQATFIAKYVREFYVGSPQLAKLIDRKRTTKHELILKNGSSILDVTAGQDADNLRGETLSSRGCLILDESAYLTANSQQTLTHITHGAGELHCSTPRRPHGAFYDCCKNPSYRTYKIPAYESPRITPEAIAELQRTLRASQFRTDVLAEFAAGENAVFDSESIDDCCDESLPLFDADSFNFEDGFPFQAQQNTNYVYSLDVARSSSIDRWVLTIGHYDRKLNSLALVAYAAWAGSRSKLDNCIVTDDPNRIIADILKFRERFPCYKFYVDATANEFFADHLTNEFLFPVEKVLWSQSRKQLLYEHLATVFRAGKISIPHDPTITRQLLDMAYDLKRMEDDSERKIYLAGDDDFVASLSMLSQVITTEPRYSKIDFCEAW